MKTTSIVSCCRISACYLMLCSAVAVYAESPSVSYIFPAGGRRGTTVSFKVGGHYLYESSPFQMRGPGIAAPERVDRTETVWFEGPVIFKPASQAQENYPKDYAGDVTISPDAPLGVRYWNVWNSQGVTPVMKFVVGDLPEIIEQEIDGAPIPAKVELPVTINGRIFPREDVDIWTFPAQAGQTITCEVCAARIGSALDSRLEVRDSAGRRITENIDALGTDSKLRFTAPRNDQYAVHIHDVKYGGLQHYVYRLTITAGPYIDAVYPLGGRRGSHVQLELQGANLPADPADVALSSAKPGDFEYRFATDDSHSNTILLDVDDLPEFLEAGPSDSLSEAAHVTLPAVLNGRILQSGEADEWTFDAKNGEEYLFDLYAARFGSHLDSVLSIQDAEGKQLATADDITGGETDSHLTFKFPADGTYTVRVTERLASRGGREFSYRLKITPVPTQPDYHLSLPDNALAIERGQEAKWKISLERRFGFEADVELSFENLPEGVTAEETTIAKGKNAVEVKLKADESAKIQTARVVVTGKAKLGEREIERRAYQKTVRGDPPIDSMMLATTIAAPFRLRAQFEQKFASQGSVYVRHYKLERNGFEGPLTIQFGDRQVRHSQGSTGPRLVVPAGVNEFDYPMTLSPFMEVGRTSRTNLAAIGELTDKDGSRHKVSFSTFDVNEQIITFTDPGRINVKTLRKSLLAQPGKTVRVPITVGRGSGLAGPMTIELRTAAHIRGVAADPIEIPPGAKEGELAIQFASGELGPFNMPLTIRATMKDERGHPLVAETALTIVLTK